MKDSCKQNETIVESSIVVCKVCGNKKTRLLKGKFPSKNKRWIDENGKQWVGHKCPDCVKEAAKMRMRLKRHGDK